MSRGEIDRATLSRSYPAAESGALEAASMGNCYGNRVRSDSWNWTAPLEAEEPRPKRGSRKAGYLGAPCAIQSWTSCLFAFHASPPPWPTMITRPGDQGKHNRKGPPDELGGPSFSSHERPGLVALVSLAVVGKTGSGGLLRLPCVSARPAAHRLGKTALSEEFLLTFGEDKSLTAVLAGQFSVLGHFPTP